LELHLVSLKIKLKHKKQNKKLLSIAIMSHRSTHWQTDIEYHNGKQKHER
jgi:hypothetical protein